MAFRFEPLVVSATDMVTFLDPVYLPYNKAGAKYLKEKLEEGMEEAKGMLNRFTAALATCINPDRNSSPKHSSAPPQPEKQPAPTHPKFRRFNHHGRVDFSMEKDFYENEYLAALTSHFYWDDVDVACFVATELAGKPTKLTE